MSDQKKFVNCPNCTAPKFLEDDEAMGGLYECDSCGQSFAIAKDTRPFEMRIPNGFHDVEDLFDNFVPFI